MEECIICFEEKNNFIFYPCTHKVCKTCFDKMDKKCPICNVSCIYINEPETDRIDTDRVSFINPCSICYCSLSIVLVYYIFR